MHPQSSNKSLKIISMTKVQSEDNKYVSPNKLHVSGRYTTSD